MYGYCPNPSTRALKNEFTQIRKSVEILNCSVQNISRICLKEKNALPQAQAQRKTKKSLSQKRKTLLPNKKRPGSSKRFKKAAPKTLREFYQKNVAASIVPPYSERSIRVSCCSSASLLTTPLTCKNACPQAMPKLLAAESTFSIFSVSTLNLATMLRSSIKTSSWNSVFWDASIVCLYGMHFFFR